MKYDFIKVGAELYWTDPDEDFSSGNCTVYEIRLPLNCVSCGRPIAECEDDPTTNACPHWPNSGDAEGYEIQDDTIVCVSLRGGGEAEVLAQELRECRHG